MSWIFYENNDYDYDYDQLEYLDVTIKNNKTKTIFHAKWRGNILHWESYKIKHKLTNQDVDVMLAQFEKKEYRCVLFMTMDLKIFVNIITYCKLVRNRDFD